MKKKLPFCLGLAILCVGTASLQSAVGQQVPAQPPQSPGDPADPGRLSNRELIRLVNAQTAAIKALDERLRELEGRVETLEDGETR